MLKKQAIFVLLLICSFSAFSLEQAKKILQDALVNEATLTYSYTENWDICELVVKQRCNSDGSIWRLEETTQHLKLSENYHVLNKKMIYKNDERFELFITQNGTEIIVYKTKTPRYKIAKKSTFEMEETLYYGIDCWKIREYTPAGYCNELLIDKQKIFILAKRYYKDQDNLLYDVQRMNLSFEPTFKENDFDIPKNAKMHYAKNHKHNNKINIKIIKEHSEFCYKKRMELKEKK